MTSGLMCVGGSCDKGCSTNSNGLLIAICFFCIIIALLCKSETIRVAVIVLVAVILISVCINYEGGYEQFTYVCNAKEVEAIKRVVDIIKKNMQEYIPKHVLDIPVRCGPESYTYQKRKIYICSADTDDNLLMYVILHEYAHAMNDKRHKEAHGKEWKHIFDTLLDAATKLKILNRNEAESEVQAYLKRCSGKGKHR